MSPKWKPIGAKGSVDWTMYRVWADALQEGGCGKPGKMPYPPEACAEEAL